jgi:peptidoglycan/LPS O-acetylase OafA/YrhL
MMGRKIAVVISLLLLIFTGVVGIHNGITEWGDADTPFQRSVTGGVFLYGLFGLVTVYGLLRRRRWTLITAAAWAVCVTYVPGAAVMAYGGEDAILGSALAASVGSALIAAAVVWTTRMWTLPRAPVEA